jgi:hypothetical protein
MLKLLWIAYAIFGLLLTVVLMFAGQLWFALAVALSFIFGPKVWKSL